MNCAWIPVITIKNKNSCARVSGGSRISEKGVGAIFFSCFLLEIGIGLIVPKHPPGAFFNSLRMY